MRGEGVRAPAVVPGGNGGLTQYDPAVGAMHIHGADKAEEIALKAKDVGALERAILAKLEAQRDFAADYQSKFQAGNPTLSNCDRPIAIGAEKYCGSFGFHIRTVQRWAERLLDKGTFEIERHERLLKVWKIVQMEQAANFSSESVEWYTPAKYIEAAREALGGAIDLDPASNKLANRTVKATKIYTAEQDGLEQDWHGRVFVNPPYGKSAEYGSLASAFCNKAMAEYESGNVSACIILVNSSHSQNWQAPLYDYVVCFVDHRIQFVSGDGEENKNPTFQNIFVYLGKEEQRFIEAFKPFGYVMKKLDG